MAKSKSAEEMDELQSRLRPFLEESGFRMRSRTCNRKTSDGLTHVINFQMGRFDPPGTSYIPWFRKNLYGKFTVNVGVYVPEVASEIDGASPRSSIQEPDCCVRKRLGALGPERSDLWWSVRSEKKTVAEVRLRLDRDAFPWFRRFETRDSLLQELEKAEETWGTGGPPRIICAILLAHRGQTEKARENLILRPESGQTPSIRNMCRLLRIVSGWAELIPDRSIRKASVSVLTRPSSSPPASSPKSPPASPAEPASRR